MVTLLPLFRYNWKVRNDWFEWCDQLSEDELLRKRTGGVGGILHTLFHIVDVEYSWISSLQGKPEFYGRFDDYQNLDQVKNLSEGFHTEVNNFLEKWSDEMEGTTLTETLEDGRTLTFTHGDILRHTIAHEIHHIGQLSVWSRELHLQPISANLLNFGK